MVDNLVERLKQYASMIKSRGTMWTLDIPKYAEGNGLVIPGLEEYLVNTDADEQRISRMYLDEKDPVLKQVVDNLVDLNVGFDRESSRETQIFQFCRYITDIMDEKRNTIPKDLSTRLKSPQKKNTYIRLLATTAVDLLLGTNIVQTHKNISQVADEKF